MYGPLIRSSPEVVRNQVFPRLRVLKEPTAVEVVDGEVKVINNVCQTAG